MSRQWMRVDATFFGSPLATKLMAEFGWAGPTLWLAFLAVCKRSTPAGQMAFISDADALAQMGFSGHRLVDDEGKEWDLDAFWTLLGRTKNVRRTSRGHVVNVRATHWEQWQDDQRRADAAERQSRSRAKKARDTRVTGPRHASQKSHAREEKRSSNTPPKPPPGGASEVASLRNGNDPAAARNGTPDGVTAKAALEALRAERGWTPGQPDPDGAEP